MSLDEMWLSECSECDWEHYSFVSHRANNWADMHTEETGHKTAVRDVDL